VVDVKIGLRGDRDVQGGVDRIVEKKGAMHIPDSRDVDRGGDV
jgi:hypothetical protein